MNNIIKHGLLSATCALAALSLASCDTDVETVDINQPGIEQQNPELYKTYLANLKTYKQGHHKVLLAGFDNSNKLPFTQAQHINAVPDSVDYVILTNPDAVNEREIKEISEIREKKGIKTVYNISFDEIKLQYDNAVSNLEASSTFPDFKTYLADTVSVRLSYCERFGLDGVIMTFRGKEKITMTDDEKAEYTGWENMFLGMAKDWAERHTDKVLMLQGKPQFYSDQTLFSLAKYLLVPCQDASSANAVDYTMQKALGDGVPTDKVVPVVETTSTDSSDKSTGWWSGSVYATIGAARFVATEHSGYTPAGLAVMNIQNDYYNPSFVYPHIREAISIINPNVKK